MEIMAILQFLITGVAFYALALALRELLLWYERKTWWSLPARVRIQRNHPGREVPEDF